MISVSRVTAKIAGLMERLRYLRFGLALLLVLIGTKVFVGNFVEIPIWMTLATTLAIIGGTAALSLLNPPGRGPPSRPNRAGR